MLYVVRKCYAMIYFMITSSEPVSEALLPIYNQLSTLKRCLIEVKKSGGVNSPRELYPYSMKVCMLLSYMAECLIERANCNHSSIQSTTCAKTANSWSMAKYQKAKVP